MKDILYLLKDEYSWQKQELSIKSTSQVFYDAIYSRLRRNHKKEFEEFKKNYNYKEKRKLLEQKYSSEEEIEQELVKWLTKYDKEFFEKFPSKTRKPTTTKYWVE